MLDFLVISIRYPKKGEIEIYPKFVIKKTEDLMIRGQDFYAIWNENNKSWSTDENEAIRLIDNELDNYYKENFKSDLGMVKILYMWDSDTGVIDKWHKYCQKQMRDSFHMLDEKLLFANSEVGKSDYSSKRLSYPLDKGDISAYDKMVSVLYSPDERHKIEWAIGSIINGDSKKIQKFMVLYGAPGSGKGTIINMILMLFDGYSTVFDAKALGSSNNLFALEAFKSNPLVAIQHDGDLSKIEDNTRINSLVSHELMTVNEKFKSTYSNSFKAFLFMGTNKPVKITDAKSGIIRRLIDVSPTGEKLSKSEYVALMSQIKFELGAIAYHCKEVYENNPNYYDNYIPVQMMGASNDFYNFVADSFFELKKEDVMPLKVVWEMYQQYCAYANVTYPMSQRVFKEEMRNYYEDFKDRATLPDGTRVRNCYINFLEDKFSYDVNKNDDKKASKEECRPLWLDFNSSKSVFDTLCENNLAQYANDEGTPIKKWDNVNTRLKDLETTKLHYVRPPENHIVIDFDIRDESGNKSLSLNLKEASKWPPTYAELSKSGQGIHLHYIYKGDPKLLSSLYEDKIEIKVFIGNSALRRKVTKCNELSITELSSGLPTKGVKMIQDNIIFNEKAIRTMIIKNLRKEYHPATKPSMDYIKKILDDAYSSGINYDVNNLRNDILVFALGSTNNSDYCIKLIETMHFNSDEPSEYVEPEKDELVFYDVEVFPNLFLVNWKLRGEQNPVIRMINPSPEEVSKLFKYKLIGYNCRKYDNHMIYARYLGYSTQKIYELSQAIISGNKSAFFREAYNLSYTDVYDFSSKKQSLKKFEIELGIHHQELGLKWNEPVPEELWPKVAEYCDNDVIATEKTFDSKDRQADFSARLILAKVAGMTPNDTTNSLSTRIIFGTNKHPQSVFNYRNMGEIPENGVEQNLSGELSLFDATNKEYTVFDSQNRPIFPGYKYEFGKSTYRGEEVGEGGYVYAEPGVHLNCAVLDIASMHPTSIEQEKLFGDEFTKRFSDIKAARIAIKHKEFDKARTMLDGALAPFLDDPAQSKALAQALKIVINSIYGLTSATFDNPFKDKRNIDNIVAKRGALFMVNLKHAVQSKGYTVAHIKTDSIKIPNATPEIIKFVMNYGAMYGYSFEHESTYERMCLVNNAVYIAKYQSKEWCQNQYGYIPENNNDHPNAWTATGTQFAVPYVFKTLFSKEPIAFKDLCETKSVNGSLYLDFNSELPDPTAYEKEYAKLCKSASGDNIGRIHELEELMSKCHNYVFVGKIGLFCPVKSGGGVLYRESDGKYFSVTGTKGYRWVESESIKATDTDFIDRSYYASLVDDAKATISKYADVEWFTEQ